MEEDEVRVTTRKQEREGDKFRRELDIFWMIFLGRRKDAKEMANA